MAKISICFIPVDTRRRFNVYKTSIRRRRRLIDVEMTSCVYWDILKQRKPLVLVLYAETAGTLLR